VYEEEDEDEYRRNGIPGHSYQQHCLPPAQNTFHAGIYIEVLHNLYWKLYDSTNNYVIHVCIDVVCVAGHALRKEVHHEEQGRRALQ
jgi:hypothetical protein